jgi:molybdenum cofactor synthesis domain-containing protein
MEYRLLEKTELWISPVTLTNADLGACARAVGNALALEEDQIMVTDALNDRLTLDILIPTVQAEHIVAREKEVLRALSEVPGVTMTSETAVHSEGVLGLISLDEEMGRVLLERSAAIQDEVEKRIAGRVLVIATGPEVMNKQIKDTNTPYLVGLLRDAGYEADAGPVLDDSSGSITRAFRDAAENAYGVIVTTGGVGAEGKDQTVEALLALAPDASAPYVLKFKKAEGRHAKAGVRLGVARWENTLIACLPGPHDEVELLGPVLKEGLLSGWEPEVIAESLAHALRGKFLAHSGHEGDDRHKDIVEMIHGSH